MRRTTLLLTTMAVGLLVASGVALAATTVVRETFTRNTPISMPFVVGVFGTVPATPYPSEIRVRGFNEGTIRDVNLTLESFRHQSPDDVGVLLVGPQGQTALVMSEVGGNRADRVKCCITLTLDDEAPEFLTDNHLPGDQPLSTGRFKPTQGTQILGSNPVPADFPDPAPLHPYGQTLSVFDGTDPNGTWKLFVIDDTSNILVGKFGGWQLQIRARVTV
jgi:hypothetical protein